MHFDTILPLITTCLYHYDIFDSRACEVFHTEKAIFRFRFALPDTNSFLVET